ncbi:TonB family protein [Novosphingobium sp. BL-8A]|uniref:TonB family protein n=1 Tax=Novosphingobium sp. BL-8A TaxID=3127639 RepID=UPI0037565DC9
MVSEIPSPFSGPPPLVDVPERYRTSGGSRWLGLAGTASLYAVVIVALLATFTAVVDAPKPSAPLVVDSVPLASPEETPPKDKEAPRPTEKQQPVPKPAVLAVHEPVAIPLSSVQTPAVITPPRPADPAPAQTETAAPKTVPAPPAPQVSSNAADTWEGRVLARLNKYRRYPAGARSRRQQGVPYIRFVMDRGGRVLSASLERSSGFAELDREAMSLPNRAQPLPKPPEERAGDTLELVVPVEFFIR